MAEQHDALAISIVTKFCAQYQRNANHFEELLQEARMGMVEAERVFDPDKGAAFGSYVRNAIKWKLIDYSARLTGIPVTRKFRQERGYAALVLNDTGQINLQTVESHESRVSAKVDAHRLLAKLEPRERRIALGLQTCTQIELAAELHITRQRVAQIYREAMRKLRQCRFRVVD